MNEEASKEWRFIAGIRAECSGDSFPGCIAVTCTGRPLQYCAANKYNEKEDNVGMELH